jgi:hypothetical protein
MSCDAVAFSAMLWMASFNPGQAAGPAPAVLQQPAVPQSVAGEPLFLDIVKRAKQLKAEAETYRQALAKADPTAAASKLKGFDAFSTKIGDLSALDMKGHVTLKERGAVDDLKCILRGHQPGPAREARRRRRGHDDQGPGHGLARHDLSAERQCRSDHRAAATCGLTHVRLPGEGRGPDRTRSVRGVDRAHLGSSQTAQAESGPRPSPGNGVWDQASLYLTEQP